MNRLYTIHCGAATIIRKGVVSDLAFSRFLESAVTPRFPGFTIRSGIGYWNGVAEPTREIVIAGSKSDRFSVSEIASEYAARFGQESVLVLTVELLAADFVEGTITEQERLDMNKLREDANALDFDEGAECEHASKELGEAEEE